jgi:hypothetical protein
MTTRKATATADPLRVDSKKGNDKNKQQIPFGTTTRKATTRTTADLFGRQQEGKNRQEMQEQELRKFERELRWWLCRNKWLRRLLLRS